MFSLDSQWNASIPTTMSSHQLSIFSFSILVKASKWRVTTMIEGLKYNGMRQRSVLMLEPTIDKRIFILNKFTFHSVHEYLLY